MSVSYLCVPAEKALTLTWLKSDLIQFSDSEISDKVMEQQSADVTDRAIAELVDQALVGPEKVWQRQLVTALMPVWLAMMAYIIWALLFKLESTATF